MMADDCWVLVFYEEHHVTLPTPIIITTDKLYFIITFHQLNNVMILLTCIYYMERGDLAHVSAW